MQKNFLQYWDRTLCDSLSGLLVVVVPVYKRLADIKTQWLDQWTFF